MQTPTAQNPKQLREEKKSLFNLLEIRHLVLLEDDTSRQDFHSAPSTPTLPYFFKYLVLIYLFLY